MQEYDEQCLYLFGKCLQRLDSIFFCCWASSLLDWCQTGCESRWRGTHHPWGLQRTHGEQWECWDMCEGSRPLTIFWLDLLEVLHAILFWASLYSRVVIIAAARRPWKHHWRVRSYRMCRRWKSRDIFEYQSDFGFCILDFGLRNYRILDVAIFAKVWILHKIYQDHAHSGRKVQLFNPLGSTSLIAARIPSAQRDSVSISVQTRQHCAERSGFSVNFSDLYILLHVCAS